MLLYSSREFVSVCFDERAMVPLNGFAFERGDGELSVSLDLRTPSEPGTGPLQDQMNRLRIRAHSMHPFAGAPSIAAEDLGKPYRVVWSKLLDDNRCVKAEELTIFHDKGQAPNYIGGEDSHAVILRGDFLPEARFKFSIYDGMRNPIVNEKVPIQECWSMFWGLREAVNAMIEAAIYFTNDNNFDMRVGGVPVYSLSYLSQSQEMMRYAYELMASAF